MSIQYSDSLIFLASYPIVFFNGDMMINSHYVWIPDKENVIKKVGNGHFNAVAFFGAK